MRIQAFFLVLMFLWASPVGAQESPKLFINEFLASNVTTNADIVDFDDFSDWIELYNAGDVDVDIGGYFVTDNPGNRHKWEFPAPTIIRAKGFLLIWTDDYDEVPGKELQRSYYPYDTFTTRYCHLNFKLDKAGEFIGLVGPDSVFIDSLSFGVQERDISVGRKPDGSTNWFYFGEPTPAVSNTSEGILSIVYADPPTVSLESGLFVGNQTVTMHTASGTGEIRYTLDGSKPTSASPLYSTPLSIGTTTILKARAFQQNTIPSVIVTRTFVINDGSTLPVMSLSTPPELLWDQQIGIYEHNFKSREIPVHVDFFTEGKTAGFGLDASLALSGQASLLYPQKSFTVAADDRFGTEAITYQVFPQWKVDTYRSLYLRNAGVPDNRSTFFRDALIHSLVLNKIDIDCQAYRPTVVFLNAQYWGIYNIRDKTDRFYVGTLHNVNPDDVDMLEYETEITPTVMEGHGDNYDAFFEYISGTDLSVTANYRHLETWMDVDEYLNYQITEIYCDNVFWADENVRMWRERRPGGRWRWILQDTDYGFGMPNIRSRGYSNNTLRFATSSNFSDRYVPPLWSTLLFRKLLQNDEFKTRFIQRCVSYLNTVFHPDTVVSLIDQFENRLSTEMPRHIERWKDGEPYFGNPIPDYSAWRANVNVLRTFARNRPFYQRQHISEYFQLGGTCILNFTIVGPGMGRLRVNNTENIMQQSGHVYFKGVPTKLEAIPEIGYRFVRWEGIPQTTENSVDVVTLQDTLSISAVFEEATVTGIPGRISRDTVLTQAHAPYYAKTDVVVDSGVTLRITEGVRLLMPEGASLMIQGRLLVEGTQANPVVISPNEHAPSWGALCFVNATDSSVVSDLTIIGATKGPDFARDRAAVSGYNSRFSVRNLNVDNVLMPVFIRYGSVTLDHCRLHSTSAGDLINIKQADFALTENCDLMGDEGFDSDGIDYDSVHSGAIRNNRIYGIYGFNSDAIDLGEGARDILIEQNVIFNILDKGVSVGQGSTALIRRNVIANCGMGVAVKDFDSHAQIEQNTFYANHVGVACYEKILGHGGGRADVVNSIIASSVESPILVDGLSSITLSYCLSNTDILPGLYNQKAEPLFLNDLYLSPTSPAINSGNPLLPADPDGSLPDLGAYPYDAQKTNALIIDEIHYHPVEGESFQFVEMKNISPSGLNLAGYRLTGSIEHTFGNVTVPGGGFIVIARNSSMYEGRGFPVVQWSAGTLPQRTGSISLSDGAGTLIDFVNYHNREFWPTEPDGTGPSLELDLPSLENMVSSSWRPSYAQGGTPGRSGNSVPISGLFVNEFMADNDAVLADESGEYDDWIEIYNRNTFPINIGGLYFTDNFSKPTKHLIPRTDPQLTTIPAKGYLVLWADDQVTQGVLHLAFKLDRTAEQIGMAQSLDAGVVFIDSLTFSAQSTNRSYGRSPDGAGTWSTFSSPTPRGSNTGTTEVGETLQPIAFGMMQNYPNPFNPSTTIRYGLPSRSHVSLTVFNTLGQQVALLQDGGQEAGYHEVRFEGNGLSSGVYFYRIQARPLDSAVGRDSKSGAGSFVLTRKLVLLR